MGNWNDGGTWNGGGRWSQPTVILTPKPTHMRDLTIWLTNPFDDPHISVKELLAFTADHLTRTTANPLPALTLRLAPTTAALAGVGATHGEDDAQLGVRKAHVHAKQAYRAALLAGVGKIAVAVEAKYGEHADELTECFPQGRKIFSTCSDQEVAAKLTKLKDWVTAHTPPLDAAMVTAATTLLTGWNAVLNPSETAIGAKTSTIAAKNAARAALQLELFKNLLALAEAFPRQPEQLSLYMQQSLLQPHTQSPADPTPPPPTPTPAP